MYIPKEGQVFLMWDNSARRNVFKIITQVDTKEEPIMESVGFFKRRQPTGKFNTILKRVWYRVVGDHTGMQYSSPSTAMYDWEKLISDADILLHQAEKII